MKSKHKMAVVKTRYTRAIKKKKQRKRVEQKQEKQECNMIGYKARANIEKKKTGLKTKFGKYQLEILPTISKTFGFHSRSKKPRILPWKKNFCTN